MLTQLGGGVFANDVRWIAAAIGRAVGEVRSAGASIDVRVLHFGRVDAAYVPLADG